MAALTATKFLKSSWYYPTAGFPQISTFSLAKCNLSTPQSSDLSSDTYALQYKVPVPGMGLQPMGRFGEGVTKLLMAVRYANKVTSKHNSVLPQLNRSPICDNPLWHTYRYTASAY